MNIKTNLLEKYVNFVDSTKKQEKLSNFDNFNCYNYIFVFTFSPI